MQDCKDEQNYLNFLQLEKTVGSIDDNSTSLHQLNHENLSLTYNMNQEVSPLNHQTKRIKKKKRVIFHYKKKRRNTKLIEMNNNNPFTVEEDQKSYHLCSSTVQSLAIQSKTSMIGTKTPQRIDTINTFDSDGIQYWGGMYLFLVINSDYRRLNCKRDSEKVDCSDLTQIIDEMTIFPEFKDLLSQLVYRVHSYFN